MPTAVTSESLLTLIDVQIFVEAGTTRTVTFSLIDINGSPLDLTGAELVWITSTNLEKTSALGDITILAPATAGAGTFTITAAETQALLPQGELAARIPHQMKVKVAGGEIYEAWDGDIRVSATMIDAW